MDKQLIAQRFGRRAATYDSAATVQRRMRDRLVDQLRQCAGRRRVRRILELGCGTGALTTQLAALFPSPEIVAVDISAEMTDMARKCCPSAEFVVDDAEHYVRRESAQFDLITSNATIQWFDDPIANLASCRARLTRGGTIRMATFGEQTFRELRTAFAAAYRDQQLPARQHALPFPSLNCWRKAFPELELRQELVVATYTDVRSFLRTLQAAGTSYSVDHRPLSKNTWLRMRRHYLDQFSTPDGGGIEVTYEMLFLGLPAESH